MLVTYHFYFYARYHGYREVRIHALATQSAAIVAKRAVETARRAYSHGWNGLSVNDMRIVDARRDPE